MEANPGTPRPAARADVVRPSRLPHRTPTRQLTQGNDEDELAVSCGRCGTITSLLTETSVMQPLWKRLSRTKVSV